MNDEHSKPKLTKEIFKNATIFRSIAFGYFYCILTSYFTRGLFDYLSPEAKNFKKIGPAKTVLFQLSYSRQTRPRVA